MSKDEKPAKSCNLRAIPKEAERLFESFSRAELYELAAVNSLNAKLALHLERMLPRAIALANAAKPDTRLLRMIIRFASVASRRIAAEAKHK